MRIPPERLCAADLINLAVEANDTPMHMGALAILDGRALCDGNGRLPLAAICTEIDRRLGGVPRLRRVLYRPRLLAGGPLWIDDPNFSVDRHVFRASLARPGDETALLRLTESLMAEVMDRTHPLWQIWFVTGLPDGRVGVLIKLHHVIADGLAAVQLVTSLFDPPKISERNQVSPGFRRPRHHGASWWVTTPTPNWRRCGTWPGHRVHNGCARAGGC